MYVKKVLCQYLYFNKAVIILIFSIFSYLSMTKKPSDITNSMLMEAIHSIKADLQELKVDVDKRFVSLETRINKRFEMFEERIEGRMENMEICITKRVVEESDRLARVIVPSNKQLAAEVVSIKKHIGLVG